MNDLEKKGFINLSQGSNNSSISKMWDISVDESYEDIIKRAKVLTSFATSIGATKALVGGDELLTDLLINELELVNIEIVTDVNDL